MTRVNEKLGKRLEEVEAEAEALVPLRQDLARVSGELETATAEVERATGVAAARLAEIDTLTAERSEWKGRARTAEEDLRMSQEVLAAARRDATTKAEQAAARLAAATADWTADRASLESARDEAVATVERLRGDLAARTADLEEANTSLRRAESEARVVEAEREHLAKTVSRLQERVEALTDDVAGLRTKAATLTASGAEKDETIRILENRAAHLESDKEACETKVLFAIVFWGGGG